MTSEIFGDGKLVIGVMTAIVTLIIARLPFFLTLLKKTFQSFDTKLSNSTAMKDVLESIREIREALIANGTLSPFVKSCSPKKIQPRGYELLAELPLDEWFKNVPDFGVTESEAVFYESYKWIENNLERKIIGAAHSSNISKEGLVELLALYLRDKALKGIVGYNAQKSSSKGFSQDCTDFLTQQ